MRRARERRDKDFNLHLKVIVDAHQDVVLLTGRGDAYKYVREVADSFGVECFELDREYYDPEVVCGKEKLNWIMDLDGFYEDRMCLSDIFNCLSIFIRNVFRRMSGDSVLVYLDSLMLELVYLILGDQSLAVLRRNSIYLDEFCVAIIVREELGGQIQTLLLKSNVLAADAFHRKASMRLIRGGVPSKRIDSEV